MASTAKSSTKWGSFFEKAVAGVESRLDNILGDDDDIPKVDNHTAALKTEPDTHESLHSIESGRSLG